jgi:hypothetical protein
MSAPLQFGRIDALPNAEYHACAAISVSKLKIFRHSPALYHGRFVTKTISPPEPTPALLFGSAAGTLILEGRDVFNGSYYIIPEGVGRVRVADKAVREDLAAKNPGKEALSHETAVAITTMNRNVHSHQLAGPLLAACKPEITWRIPGELFNMQVRTDAFSEEGCELTQRLPFIADLKTIAALPDDEPDVISRQIMSFSYHLQAVIYRSVVSEVLKFKDDWQPPFYFIFVAKEPPYSVKVVELDQTALDLAYRQVSDTLHRLKECYRTGRWPLAWDDMSPAKKVPSVGLPGFYLKREMGETPLWG